MLVGGRGDETRRSLCGSIPAHSRVKSRRLTVTRPRRPAGPGWARAIRGGCAARPRDLQDRRRALSPRARGRRGGRPARRVTTQSSPARPSHRCANGGRSCGARRPRAARRPLVARHTDGRGSSTGSRTRSQVEAKHCSSGSSGSRVLEETRVVGGATREMVHVGGREAGRVSGIGQTRAEPQKQEEARPATRLRPSKGKQDQ